MSVFYDHTLENRHRNSVLPYAEMKIVQREQDVLEEWGHIQGHRWSHPPALLPNLAHQLILLLFALLLAPVQNEHLAFVRRAGERGLLLL